jgi:hypothetical protein
MPLIPNGAGRIGHPVCGERGRAVARQGHATTVWVITSIRAQGIGAIIGHRLRVGRASLDPPPDDDYGRADAHIVAGLHKDRALISSARTTG